MLLFYSIHCKHCAMLLDNVRRLDATGQVKLIDIDALRQTHPNVYQQLQAVPALMLMPSKELMYGKAVFDYLLLPSRGKLVTGSAPAASAATTSSAATGNANTGCLHIEEGVMAFNGSKGLYSDSFADIHETESTPNDPANNPHTAFHWMSIDEMMRSGTMDDKAPALGISSSAPGGASTGMGLETRAPKETVDVDSIRREREKDLQSLYAGQTMPI
jgi:hypothetical protein